MSFYEFQNMFPDSRACIRHIASTKYGHDLQCPRCTGSQRLSSTGKLKQLYCPKCRLYVSPLSTTLMRHSKVAAWDWFYCMLIIANSTSGVTVDQLARHLGVSRLAAYRMLCLIRLHIRELNPPRPVGGPNAIVHIDETWLPNVWESSQRNGKGAIVFGIHDQHGAQCWVIPNRKRSTIIGLIEKWVASGSTVVTDSHRSYHSLNSLGFTHVSLNHTRGEWSKDGHSTAWIESYWTSLKYFLRSRNRLIKEDILPLYLAEHAFRHNAQLAGACPFRLLISAFPQIDQSLLPPGANPTLGAGGAPLATSFHIGQLC